MRHAYLRREATAVRAKAAAALLYEPAVCYLVRWYGCFGRVLLWWDELCDGEKKQV